MIDSNEKYQYLKLLVRHGNNSYNAAFALHPNDSHRAMRLIMEVGAPNAHGEFKDAELTKLYEQVKSDVYKETGKDADDIYLEIQLRNIIEKAVMTRDRIEALKLFAKIKGKEQGQGNSTSVTLVMPKVIEKETFGDNTSWEAACEKQQIDLHSVSRSKH